MVGLHAPRHIIRESSIEISGRVALPFEKSWDHLSRMTVSFDLHSFLQITVDNEHHIRQDIRDAGQLTLTVAVRNPFRLVQLNKDVS